MLSRSVDTSPMGWNAERVLAALRSAGQERGAWWTIAAWKAIHKQPTVDIVYRHCGSWAKAWAQAGYAPPARWRQRPRVTYTDEEILGFLQQAARTSNKILTTSFYSRWQRAVNAPVMATIMHRFGSWESALRQAGLPCRQDLPVPDLVAAVVCLAHTLGHPPTQSHWSEWPDRPVSLFMALQQWGGTWDDLLDVARQSDPAWPIRLSRSRAVAHLLSQPDDRLTSRERALADLLRAGHTLASAGAVAGLSRARVHQIAHNAGKRQTEVWTQTSLAIHLRRWLDTHAGRAPTIVQWKALGETPSSGTIIRYFGTWRHAWVTLGGQFTGQWPPEVITARMRRWLDTHAGCAPTVAEWNGMGESPSCRTIVQHFGTWRGAWIRVGAKTLPHRGRPGIAS